MTEYITVFDMENSRIGIAGNNIKEPFRVWKIVLIAVFGGLILITGLIVVLCCCCCCDSYEPPSKEDQKKRQETEEEG